MSGAAYATTWRPTLLDKGIKLETEKLIGRTPMRAGWNTRTSVGLMLSPLFVLFAQIATTATASAEPSTVTSHEQVTFSKYIAPIFQAKCQECHQPNSVAPMSLITFREARPCARSINERVVTRQMPPWHIDQSV